MTLLQALELLKQVHTGDTTSYLDRLVARCADGRYTLAIKRKSKGRAVIMREFCGDSEGCIMPLDFGECNFLYIDDADKTVAYLFTCEDLLASDWDCFIYDCNGEYNYETMEGGLKESFSGFFVSRYGRDELLDYDGVKKGIAKLYAEYGSDKIQRIDIYTIFGNISEPFYKNRMDLSSTNYEVKDWHILDCVEKLGYGKDDVFEIEVELTNGTSFNLAEFGVFKG